MIFSHSSLTRHTTPTRSREHSPKEGCMHNESAISQNLLLIFQSDLAFFGINSKITVYLMWRSCNALVFFVLILGETAWGWNWSGGVGDLITYDCIFFVNLTSTVHDLFLWVMIACLVIFWPCQLDCHSTRPHTCSSSIFWLLVNLTAVVHDFFAERTFAQAVFFGIVVNLTATVHDFLWGLWVGFLPLSTWLPHSASTRRIL